MRYLPGYAFFVLFVFCTCVKGQTKTDLPADTTRSEKDVISSYGPSSITRSIIQDKTGTIWIATFAGIFRYDGKSFTNITSKVSSDRFFSVLEDTKGNLWFGSLGSGVYYYDGKSLRQFTTQHGLVSNEIYCLYQDKTGTIWFGATGGVSRYDGKSFQNFVMNRDAMTEDRPGKVLPDFTRSATEVNSIVEDKTGKFWFGTRGNLLVYNGNKFTVITYLGKPFRNVRSIIKDKKGTIWLGGTDGLWRYDGRAFTNLTRNGVAYVYEDTKGNIWTSSLTNRGWVLSRYEEKTLSSEKPTRTVIENDNEDVKGMLFGISEAQDGSIWFGSYGAYRYDGTTITDFKDKYYKGE